MIIIMKATATTTDITDLKDRLESRGLRAVVMQGQEKTAVGVIGETRLHLPADQILALPSVESIRRVSDPCKLANRLFHPEDTIVKAGSAKVGGGHFAMIAGPCSVESEEQRWLSVSKRPAHPCSAAAPSNRVRRPTTSRGSEAKGLTCSSRPAKPQVCRSSLKS